MMVNRRACPVEDCDTRVDALTHDGDLACAEHDEPLEFVGKVGCVRGLNGGQIPAADVREYAEGLRETAQNRPDSSIAAELEQLADQAPEDDLGRRDVRQLGTEGEDDG